LVRVTEQLLLLWESGKLLIPQKYLTRVYECYMPTREDGALLSKAHRVVGWNHTAVQGAKSSHHREEPLDHTYPGIFISYRRSDEPVYVDRLHFTLARKFGQQQIFRDVDSIELGEKFADVLQMSLGACKVVLVVIGQGWLTVTDDDGERRLDDDDDFVRMEIGTALMRPGITVIPILVNGTRMPRTHELPLSLAGLAGRHGHAMSHDRFDADAMELIRKLERILQ
jgi:hypothetical protein